MDQNDHRFDDCVNLACDRAGIVWLRVRPATPAAPQAAPRLPACPTLTFMAGVLEQIISSKFWLERRASGALCWDNPKAQGSG